MAQYDENQMHICGEKNNMINYKGKVFSILYPRDQIEEDIKHNCKNCEYYGSWNGCQIMRCVDCNTTGNGALMKGTELNSSGPLSAVNTYLKEVDWDTIGDKALEDSHQIECELHQHIFVHNFEYMIDRNQAPYTYTLFEPGVTFYENMDCQYGWEDEDQEDEAADDNIQVFITENGQENKWFEMKIQEYDDEHSINYNVNDNDSTFHKINARFFTETNQYLPRFQNTASTFCERSQYGLLKIEADDLDDEISTDSTDSSAESSTTYTTMPNLIDYDNKEEDADSESDEELQKIKRSRVNFTADTSRLKLADLLVDVVDDLEEDDLEEDEDLEEDLEEEEEKETQQEYELRTQTGIFDWPNKTRLNEDECI